MINVAGSTDIESPLSQHILTVELRGAELADSPLQRDSVFRQAFQDNPEITVDLRKTGIYNGRRWYGTPLADLSGYIGLIERTVGELTVAGGTVNLEGGASVVIQPGATVNTSGGFINYGGGSVRTTRVLYANHLMEISDATPNRLYQGIYTGLFTENHPRWGVTKTFRVPWMTGEHYEQPYTQGAAGGVLGIAAAAVALDGELFGYTVNGPRQRGEPAAPSSLSITLDQNQAPVPAASKVTFDDASPGAGRSLRNRRRGLPVAAARGPGRQRVPLTIAHQRARVRHLHPPQ